MKELKKSAGLCSPAGLKAKEIKPEIKQSGPTRKQSFPNEKIDEFFPDYRKNE